MFRAQPLARKLLILKIRRDVRVVEGARLESVCRGNSTVGSNPTLSASLRQALAPLAGFGWQASDSRERHAKAVHRSCSRSERSAKVDESSPRQPPSLRQALASLAGFGWQASTLPGRARFAHWLRLASQRFRERHANVSTEAARGASAQRRWTSIVSVIRTAVDVDREVGRRRLNSSDDRVTSAATGTPPA
jgi:hypothetical protein